MSGISWKGSNGLRPYGHGHRQGRGCSVWGWR